MGFTSYSLIDVWDVATFDLPLNGDLDLHSDAIRNYRITYRRLWLADKASDHIKPSPRQKLRRDQRLHRSVDGAPRQCRRCHKADLPKVSDESNFAEPQASANPYGAQGLDAQLAAG